MEIIRNKRRKKDNIAVKASLPQETKLKVFVKSC